MLSDAKAMEKLQNDLMIAAKIDEQLRMTEEIIRNTERAKQELQVRLQQALAQAEQWRLTAVKQGQLDQAKRFQYQMQNIRMAQQRLNHISYLSSSAQIQQMQQRAVAVNKYALDAQERIRQRELSANNIFTKTYARVANTIERAYVAEVQMEVTKLNRTIEKSLGRQSITKTLNNHKKMEAALKLQVKRSTEEQRNKAFGRTRREKENQHQKN